MSLTSSMPNLITSDFITLSGTYFFLGGDLPMNFGGHEPFTIEGWVGFTSLDSAAPIFSRAGELVFGFSADGHMFARRRFWEAPLISSEPLQPGAWHHVGITCDGETWTLYVNGVADGEIETSVATDSGPQNIGTLKRSAALGCEVWNLRIWSRARTDAQMVQAMNSVMVPQNGLVASFFPELPAASQLRLGEELVSSAA